MSEARIPYEVLTEVAEIRIPGLPPVSQSPNSRAGWQQRWSERQGYMQTVGRVALAGGVKDLKLPWAKVQVEFVVAENRRRDVDNFLARCKPIFDSLVNLGVLIDDDAKHLEVSPLVFTVDPMRGPATIVRIWK